MSRSNPTKGEQNALKQTCTTCDAPKGIWCKGGKIHAKRLEASEHATMGSLPNAEIELITPERAEEYLGKNQRNRGIRALAVNAYARDMKEGRWQLTGEAIKFDTDGVLLDGQHRLLAIIRANVPVLMYVMRNLSAASQAVMDAGVKRAAYDRLKLDGAAYPMVVSSIARLNLRLDGNRGATNAELLDWIDARYEAVLSAAEVAAHYRSSIDLHPSVCGTAWLTLSQVDPEDADRFFKSLSEHQTSGRGDPRQALLRRLQTARRSNERLSQQAQLSLIYRAWNAWRQEKQLMKLPIESRGGAVEIPTPK